MFQWLVDKLIVFEKGRKRWRPLEEAVLGLEGDSFLPISVQNFVRWESAGEGQHGRWIVSDLIGQSR